MEIFFFFRKKLSYIRTIQEQEMLMFLKKFTEKFNWLIRLWYFYRCKLLKMAELNYFFMHKMPTKVICLYNDATFSSIDIKNSSYISLGWWKLMSKIFEQHLNWERRYKDSSKWNKPRIQCQAYRNSYGKVAWRRLFWTCVKALLGGQL